ncbi:MAG: SGNH/GDSL hydrolase family protein [Xenococcaceae cyanobacterium]
MFKSRHRRSSFYSNPYYSKPKRRLGFLPLLLILSVPLLLILLEVLARIFVGVTGKSTELAVYEGEPPMVTAYSLKFLTESEKPVEGLSDRGSLLAKRSLSVGYQLLGNQQNEFWQINEQGFRDNDSLPLAKPKNEIRIFVLGGSTAFGQWNQNNEDTIASKLEARLKERVTQQKRSPNKYRPDVFPFYKPDRAKALALPPKIREGQYRVINAAVPGYASGNELAQLALQILPYKPDMIVVLGGYVDLMLPSSETKTDIPMVEDFLKDAPGHFGAYLNQSLKQWLKGTYFVKTLEYFVFKPQSTVAQKSLVVRSQAKPLAQYLSEDEAELERRVLRYQENHTQMVNLCAGLRIPLVIAVQPEITGRPTSKLSKDEQAIRDELGKNYTERIPKAYTKLVQASKRLERAFPKNVKVLNFYNQAEDFPTPAFSDAIHLTEKANTVMAEGLYHAITAWQKIQVIPKNLYLEKKSN